MSLWFVTPAYRRYDMTALCLEQRSRVIAELAEHGIEAHQVVIADDDNLDIAKAWGAATVERDNRMVGRKFNDGMEYAGRQGAEWIVPIGSDSWIASDYFLDPEPPDITRTSEAYCTVTARTLAELCVSPERMDWTAGPYVFHRSLLEPVAFRPSKEDSDMVDTDTIIGIESRTKITWRTRTVHPFQYIGFRMPPMMTTAYSLWRKWGVREHEPWGTLRRYYPADLVDRAKVLMAKVPPEVIPPPRRRRRRR